MSAMPARKLDKQQRPQSSPQVEPQQPPLADRDWHPDVGLEYAERRAATPRLRTGRQYEAEAARRENADRAWHPRVSEPQTGVSSADAAWHPEVGAKFSDPAARRSAETRAAVERKRAISKLADSAWHPAVDDIQLPAAVRHQGWRPVEAPNVDGPVHTRAPQTPARAAAVAAEADRAWHPGAEAQIFNGPAVVEADRPVGDRRGGSWHPEVNAEPRTERAVAPRPTADAEARRVEIRRLADNAWHPTVD
jgi:hypothetical protein